METDERTDRYDEDNSRFPQCLNAPENIQYVIYLPSPQQQFYAKNFTVFIEFIRPYPLLRNPVHDIKYSFSISSLCMNILEVISVLLVNFVNGVVYYKYINLRTKC
jgi:hypothetical protein